MVLGAYSIVRYSNHLSDQRVNLGVLLWHPIDGFTYRFSSSLERVRAIDQRARLKSLRVQLDLIRGELDANQDKGREVLLGLSRAFKEGLEVTSPYPARIQSLQELLDHLYEMLVSAVPEIRRASSQTQFEKKVATCLSATFEQVCPKGTFEDLGTRAVNGVHVEAGIRTSTSRRTALWRALSLQAKDHPTDQVAVSKATALDILTVRQSFEDLKDARQIVLLQPPKPKASDGLNESIAWLEHEADDVVLVPDVESLPKLLEPKLRDLS